MDIKQPGFVGHVVKQSHLTVHSVVVLDNTQDLHQRVEFTRFLKGAIQRKFIIIVINSTFLGDKIIWHQHLEKTRRYC